MDGRVCLYKAGGGQAEVACCLDGRLSIQVDGVRKKKKKGKPWGKVEDVQTNGPIMTEAAFHAFKGCCASSLLHWAGLFDQLLKGPDRVLAAEGKAFPSFFHSRSTTQRSLLVFFF